MLEMLLGLALAAPSEPRPRAVPERQARAVVRIIRADPIRLGEEPSPRGASLLRNSTVPETDGSTRPAKLIEFY